LVESLEANLWPTVVVPLVDDAAMLLEVAEEARQDDQKTFYSKHITYYTSTISQNETNQQTALIIVDLW